MRRIPNLRRVVDFLLLADIFLFGVLLATTHNLRLSLLAPVVFDVVVLAGATTRSTKIVLCVLMIPLGAVLVFFRVPYGWVIAVMGLVLALTFTGKQEATGRRGET